MLHLNIIVRYKHLVCKSNYFIYIPGLLFVIVLCIFLRKFPPELKEIIAALTRVL